MLRPLIPGVMKMSKHIGMHVPLVVLLVTLLLSACQRGSQEQAESQSFQASVIDVKAVTEPGYAEITGAVVGDSAVPIATKLFSAITYMGFEEGDPVAKGDVLARIDDSDIQAMRSEAAAYRAEAAGALAEVETVVAQGRAGKAQAEAALAQAEAAHSDAVKDFERAERLAAEDSIPRVQRDKAELGVEIAKQGVEQARSAVAQTEALIAQAEAKRPQVSAKEQQAAAKDAQAAANQSYATLTAPFDGVVTRKLSEQGQMAIPGQPIYIVEDNSSFRVELNVPEHLVGLLAAGDQLDVAIEQLGHADQATNGTVLVIGAASNPGTHTVRVELALEPMPGMFSGRFVRVRIPSGEQEKVVIPESAVFYEGEQAFVWRLSSSGIIGRAPVEVAPAGDGKLVAIRGLSDGDRIVSEVVPGLFSGARIAGAVTHQGAGSSKR